MSAEPVSATLVAWGNAWLAGRASLDDAVDAVEYAHGPQRVDGLPGEGPDLLLRSGLGTLRSSGLGRMRLALPSTGDPLGLSGPPELNAIAVESGEVALADLSGQTLGLVPAADRRGSSYEGIRWKAHPANTGMPDIPSLPEAEQELTIAMRDATNTLLELDVPRWHPEAARTLAALRGGPSDEAPIHLPEVYPARAHRVAGLAGRLALVLHIALTDEGGAVSAGEMLRRREALRELERAVRRARVAAYNAA